MSDPVIPPERAWNSWDSEHPAEMSYSPLGLSLRPCAYAASVNRFTDFPAGAGLRLGPRAIDGDGIALDLAHAGTELTLAYDKPVPHSPPRPSPPPPPPPGRGPGWLGVRPGGGAGGGRASAASRSSS